MAATATRGHSSRLSRFFPGLARTTPVAPGSSPAAQVVAAPEPTSVPTGPIIAANPIRPSWFGLRKAKVPQTYLTDVRGTAPRGKAVEPSYLPVALQVPTDRITDRAVTPTTAEVDSQDAEPGPIKSATTIPPNPDSSSAAAEPISTTEPQLAVKPFGSPTPEPAASKSVPSLAPEATANSPEPAEASKPTEDKKPAVTDQPSMTDQLAEPSKPADPVDPPTVTERPAEPTPPAVDPRERPRLNDLSQAASTAPKADSQPAPEPAAVATRTGASGSGEPDPRAVKAAPSVADPDRSLGLPPVTVPASYTQHNSVAVRGSYQTSQPGPILASPQFETAARSTPQSSAAQPASSTTAWQPPSVRRLVRRMWKLGEFASPPTAKPH